MTSRVLRTGLVAAIVLLAGTAVAYAGSTTNVQGPDADAGRASREAFRAQMRVLWQDHVVWTRQYIVSAATEEADLPDIIPTADRLFANQREIGNAVAAFYGDAAGDALTALLDDHIAIAAEAIGEAKAEDEAGLQNALDRWYANADDIAAFLAAANPDSWPLAMMRAHMRDHLDLTLREAVARLDGQYADDIAAYDLIRTQIAEMADMLADGIIADFPGRFGR
jgi:hypothetical protein